MGLLAIEAAPQYRGPVFLADQDTGDITAADMAARNGVSFQCVGASIAVFPARWLLESKTVESSLGRSRGFARAPVAVAACVLWLLIGAVWDNGLCGESDTRAQGSVGQVVGTTVEQKQTLERGRKKVDIPAGRLTPAKPLDAAQGKATPALPSGAPAAGEQKRVPEREQGRDSAETAARGLSFSPRGEPGAEREWDKAEAIALALTSSLRAELDAVRSAATGGFVGCST